MANTNDTGSSQPGRSRQTRAASRPSLPNVLANPPWIRYTWPVSMAPPARPARAPERIRAPLATRATRTPNRRAATGLAPLIRRCTPQRLRARRTMKTARRTRAITMPRLTPNDGYDPGWGRRTLAGNWADWANEPIWDFDGSSSTDWLDTA